MADAWSIEGEFLLSCNCELFCPCVISLGKARPTEGRCLSWWAVAIHAGVSGDCDLSGLNVAILLEVPERMAEGGWTLGLYVDERASEAAGAALETIFTGSAGGNTGWWSVMLASYLGMRRAAMLVEDGRVEIPRVLQGTLEPVLGPDGSPTRVTNSAYWVAPDIDVCTTSRSRVRDWGRNWDFTGRSAERARISWRGP